MTDKSKLRHNTPRPPQKRPPTAPPRPRVALALAGGGPLGAIYEIGALCALEEVLSGFRLESCDHFVGVSAGGFIAAGLANGMSPRQLCDLFIDPTESGAEAFDPAWLMRPAYAEMAQRLTRLPGLGARALWSWTVGGKPLISALEKMAPALPTGVFSNEAVHRQIERLFTAPGRTNDFRQLKKRLTLVATHLDSGEAAPFGRPGWDHVPISKAIAASAALPGLFPPVEIDGRHYVDGALKKTMHATVALDEGVDVMFCLNPLVPFDATAPESPPRHPVRKGRTTIPSMVEGGFPAVMSQTFRSMIHSRLELGMKQYEHLYPNTTIVLIEPDHRDGELFLANTFSYHQRRELAEHAYQQTRQLLRSQFTTLSHRLARHQLRLDPAALQDDGRRLLKPHEASGRFSRSLRQLHDSVDDLQHALSQGTLTRKDA